MEDSIPRIYVTIRKAAWYPKYVRTIVPILSNIKLTLMWYTICGTERMTQTF